MAQSSGARPADELHLGHQFGPNPANALFQRVARNLQAGRPRPFERVQAGAQAREFVLGESRAHAAGIMQGAGGIVIAEVEGAQPGAAAARRGPAEHHEFLAAPAFQLHPPLAAAGTIGSIGALADDAFQPVFAGLATHPPGIAGVVVAVADQPLPGIQRSEHLLSIPQRARP